MSSVVSQKDNFPRYFPSFCFIFVGNVIAAIAAVCVCVCVLLLEVSSAARWDGLLSLFSQSSEIQCSEKTPNENKTRRAPKMGEPACLAGRSHVISRVE